MSWTRVVAGAAGALVAFASCCGVAHASAWPVSEDAGIACGYAERYTRPDGSTAVHSGIDVIAEPGDAVLSVAEGTVIFAGRVPAAGGGTTGAVTVETADGWKWSFMPLASAAVSVGDAVEEGRRLGDLAAGGDGSSALPHVHIGLRISDRYVDPTPFLDPPQSAAGGEAASDPGMSTVTEAPPTTADLVDRVPVSSRDEPAPAPAPQSVTAPTADVVASFATPIATPFATPEAGQEAGHSSSAAPRLTDGAVAVSGSLGVDTVRDDVLVSRPSGAPTPAGTGRVGDALTQRTAPAVPFRLTLGLAFAACVGSGCLIRALRLRFTASGRPVAAAVGR